MPRRTLRGGSAGGGLVRLFLPRHPKAAAVLFIQSTYKNRLSCGVAPFSFKSTKEDPIDSCGVTDGLPPTRLASSWHNRRLSGDILFHRSSVVSRYRLLWRNRCRPVSHGPSPLSTSQCWLSIPMWNLNIQLRYIVIQKWRQERPRICSVRSLCVASVGLALIFMPGLYSTVMRLSLVCFYYLCFLFFLSITTMSFAVYFFVRSLLSAFPAYLRTFFRFDFVWFRLSCDHGWIR